MPEQTKWMEDIVEYTKKAIYPIQPLSSPSLLGEDFYLKAKSSERCNQLPPHYLVFLLFIDLLNFRKIRAMEKIAWSIPIEYEGKAYMIEHRKMGFDIFCVDSESDEENLSKIVLLINRGVKQAHPFFRHLAGRALQGHDLNVNNQSMRLLARYQYFYKRFQAARSRQAKYASSDFPTLTSKSMARTNSAVEWLALASIDAFFSWTEHVFIHMAILSGSVQNGQDVAMLAQENWGQKFKAALDINEPEVKAHFDVLLSIRNQIRNFVAHGAFGKQGEAFSFYSGAGAIPMTLTKESVDLMNGKDFENFLAIESIGRFIQFLSRGKYKRMRRYLENSILPVSLTLARNGTYLEAISSNKAMDELIERLTTEFYYSINMDW